MTKAALTAARAKRASQRRALRRLRVREVDNFEQGGPPTIPPAGPEAASPPSLAAGNPSPAEPCEAFAQEREAALDRLGAAD